ncbi:MAG: peptidase U62 [Acidobacteriaceae bacterium]|nr:peptidase U62 [Acidobacteriaceae bacterium]
MSLKSICTLLAIASAVAPAVVSASGAPSTPQPSALLDTMHTELNRAMDSLGKGEQQPHPYFISYEVADASSLNLVAQYGAIVTTSQGHRRVADVQVRIGSPALDNTHGDHRTSALTTINLPLTDDKEAIARSLWFATNRGYGKALDGYLKVKTETQVRAKEEDASPDFSVEKSTDSETKAVAPLATDVEAWKTRLREISASFKPYKNIFFNYVALTASNETDYFTSSEGTRIANPYTTARLVVVARARADDGMDLFRVETFEADSLDHLPDQKAVLEKLTALAKNLEALRTAPVTQPFNGPAILSGRASAVFFHEVLGHRLEGQRQRGDEEGQTFTKSLGKPILPDFLSVVDDPTIAALHGTPLNGHYSYDDEGQPAQRVELIQDGVLKTFLMSRLPIASVSTSNGHGRAQTGRMPAGRQGNLIVSSTRSVNDAELRKMLIEEAKKQGKPYGLFFEDISSGFAVTTRRSPQAFQVIPLVVYRVYVDGRPDELVRGVSIVGTPQAALNRILATGDRQEIFNGECGAESGSVPVSAVAPAMLVSEIETQRQAQGTTRPPILPPPGMDEEAN